MSQLSDPSGTRLYSVDEINARLNAGGGITTAQAQLLHLEHTNRAAARIDNGHAPVITGPSIFEQARDVGGMFLSNFFGQYGDSVREGGQVVGQTAGDAAGGLVSGVRNSDGAVPITVGVSLVTAAALVGGAFIVYKAVT